MNAISTKRVLTPDVLAAQGAFELPDRQMLALVTVVITNLLNNLNVDVDIRNNNVALLRSARRTSDCSVPCRTPPSKSNSG